MQCAQPLGQPRIDQRGLRFLKVNSGVLLEQGRNPVEVLRREREISRPRILSNLIERRLGHGSQAASRRALGRVPPNATGLITRPCRARTPRTNVFATSEARSAVA